DESTDQQIVCERSDRRRAHPHPPHADQDAAQSGRKYSGLPCQGLHAESRRGTERLHQTRVSAPFLGASSRHPLRVVVGHYALLKEPSKVAPGCTERSEGRIATWGQGVMKAEHETCTHYAAELNSEDSVVLIGIGCRRWGASTVGLRRG